MFRFMLSTNLYFGAGESGLLGARIRELGYSRVALIIDHALSGHPRVKEAIGSIAESGIAAQTFLNETAEPTYDYLEAFKKKMPDSDYECLVAIGGGSTIDLAKGIAVLMVNPGSAISYRGFPQLKHRPLPVIAVPTTAGTGSEVTYNAVFIDAAEKRKLGINSTLNFPVSAIIDPLLMVDCPRGVAVSAGVDALAHALESFVNKNRSALSMIFSKEAFRLVFNNLIKALDNPGDAAIRADLSLGAYLAGIALINSGPGAAGALSYPLGVHYNIPHGIAGGVFLSAIVEFNISKGYQGYAGLYELISGVDAGIPAREKNPAFLEQLKRLLLRAGIPASLSSLGLKGRDIEFLAGQYPALQKAIDQNPVTINQGDLLAILQKML